MEEEKRYGIFENCNQKIQECYLKAKNNKYIYTCESNQKKIHLIGSTPRIEGLQKHIYKIGMADDDYVVFPTNSKNIKTLRIQTVRQIKECLETFIKDPDKYKDSYGWPALSENIEQPTETNSEYLYNERKNIVREKSNSIKEEELEILLETGEYKMNNNEENKSTEDKIKDLIKNGATQIILTGAPGTGKTRMAKKIAEDQGAELTWEEKKEDSCSHYKLVQFHPSYDYTDFVEGLRPVEEEGKMVFRKVDGIFKKFCRDVAVQNEEDENNKKKKYFFLIDEINRADLSKVFGELMFCLETDKRGEDNAIQTQYQNLPTYDTKEKKYYGEDESEDVFKDGFYIPENVIIIGTMNDIDRSVESMDFALRRRFIWKEIDVDEVLLKDSLTEIINLHYKQIAQEAKPEEVAKKLAEHIMNLNSTLDDKRYNLGKHYYISQGQFANLPENIIETAVKAGKKVKEKGEEAKVEAIAKSLLEAVWNLRLNSLLYEYIRGEGNEENFVKSCHETLLVPSRSQEQPEENSQL